MGARLHRSLSWVIYALKLPIKIAHQSASLIVNRNLKNFEFKGFTESWPRGSKFIGPTMKGAIFCKLAVVDTEKIFVTNIWAEENKGGIFYIRPNFVNFSESKHLAEALSPTQDPSKQIFHQKLKDLSKTQRHQVHVLQRLNGEILVIDGTHRLIACFVRDGHLKNLDFLISFLSPTFED